jgi:hypothetical protein
VYPKAVVTSLQLIQVIYPQELASWQLSVGIVGVQDRSQYFQLVATVHKDGVQLKSQYLPEVATVHRLGLFLI